MNSRLFLMGALLVSLCCFGCERRSEASAEAPTVAAEQAGDDTDDSAESHADHEHAEEHVHLGGKMYEISRRFSAVWFAGKSGNAPMVSYQTHEMEEVIEEIEEAKPVEHGVDVSARLNSDVKVHFEKLEDAAKANDQAAFEKAYRQVMNNCTVCHADTKHGFIQVKIPEYNPYPNLAY